jgi:hypothetical protein
MADPSKIGKLSLTHPIGKFFSGGRGRLADEFRVRTGAASMRFV